MRLRLDSQGLGVDFWRGSRDVIPWDSHVDPRSSGSISGADVIHEDRKHLSCNRVRGALHLIVGSGCRRTRPLGGTMRTLVFGRYIRTLRGGRARLEALAASAMVFAYLRAGGYSTAQARRLMAG